MFKIILIYTSILIMMVNSFVIQAQDEFEDTRLYYRTELSVGGLIHTRGWGLNFRKGYRKTGFKNYLISCEIVGMEHLKETKTYNVNVEDASGFVYGKMNALTVIRPFVGMDNEVYGKEQKRGVRIGYVYMIGPTFGLVKPVYLDVAYPTVANVERIATEAYDPDKHQLENIIGKASSLKGLEKSSIYPGLGGKLGINFEYAAFDELVKSVEVGVDFDLFFQKVPIMANTENSNYYLSFYLSFQFGKKTY